jgi:hypothetical protein
MCQKYGARLWAYGVLANKPMLSSEVQLCYADDICRDVDAVALLDSDCMFTTPWSPLDNLVGGKSVLIAQSFAYLASIGNGGIVWQGVAAKALGWTPTHETMRHPTIYHRGLFEPFRKAVENHTGAFFDNYVLAQQETWPQGFAELTSLGAYAMKFFPELYYIADVKTDAINTKADSGSPVGANKLRQFWSHGPMPREEMERILA